MLYCEINDYEAEREGFQQNMRREFTLIVRDAKEVGFDDLTDFSVRSYPLAHFVRNIIQEWQFMKSKEDLSLLHFINAMGYDVSTWKEANEIAIEELREYLKLKKILSKVQA